MAKFFMTAFLAAALAEQDPTTTTNGGFSALIKAHRQASLSLKERNEGESIHHDFVGHGKEMQDMFAEPIKSNELIIFRSLKNKGAEGTTQEIKEAVDRIFDGVNLIVPGTLAVVGNEALVTIASMFKPAEGDKLSWQGAPSLAMKPMLSTLDNDYSAFCEAVDNRNKKTCNFMEPIMMFDIHSWASSACLGDLSDQLEKISSIYEKFQLMKTECAGEKFQKGKEKPTRFQKKAYARGKKYGERFLENFKDAEQLIKDEHKALESSESRLLQRYNEVGMGLLPWDIVGVDLGESLPAANELIEYIEKRRKQLLSIYQVVAGNDSPHAYIENNLQDAPEMKIFYKLLDAQYSGWVERANRESTSAAGADFTILEKVGTDIWYTVLGKIVERLRSPLKKYKYDIDEVKKISTLEEFININPSDSIPVTDHQCKNIQAKKNDDDLFIVVDISPVSESY